MNLSKTQQDVLLRMAAGARLELCMGRGEGLPAKAFIDLWDASPAQPVRNSTIEVLRNVGAIKEGEKYLTAIWRVTEYALTDAGREEASRIREIQET